LSANETLGPNKRSVKVSTSSKPDSVWGVETNYLELLTPKALVLLAEIGPLDSKANVLGLITKLRTEGHSAELVTQVVNQARLRHRAKAKFLDFANHMLFTEAGLEQATRLPVAALHAERFRQAGIKKVADLGCGIGADAMSFAALELEVLAIEQDEQTAALATFNLASFPNAKVVHADATEASTQDMGVFIDPARRQINRKGRTHIKLTPSDFSPSLDWVFEKAKTAPTAVKLGPATDHELIPEDCEAQWVSHNGDLVELMLYFGELSRGTMRSALLIKNGGRQLFDGVGEIQGLVRELGKFIYEPDNSLIRSHLLGEFANQHGLGLVSQAIAYLTSDQLLETPWLRGFEVKEVMALDTKAINKYVQEHQIGILEIKKRGVDITPEELRKKLKLKGSGTATLIMTKVGGARKAIIAKAI
jgi:hypothetical protein